MSEVVQSDDHAALDEMSVVRHELQAIYRDLDRILEQLAPVCALSGRCCRFQEYGHTLFLSGAEAQLLLADAPPPVRALDDGQSCPWQDLGGRCSARGARPLGCRVFFCDPAFEEYAPELSEKFLSRLKRLAERHGWPWNYAPLHVHLQEARTQGRLPSAIGGPDHGPIDNCQP
jgi:hypothetical protein